MPDVRTAKLHHGRIRDECLNCIRAAGAVEADARAELEPVSGAEISARRVDVPSASVIPNPRSITICSCCAIKHAVHLACPCRRCHSRHPEDADCPSAEYTQMYPSICCGCGIKHAPHLPCPCPRCHTRHPDADCPELRCTSFSGGDVLSLIPIFLSGPLSFVEVTDRVCIACCVRHSHHSTCPCVRCHRLHPDSDCNISIGNMEDPTSQCCIRCGCAHWQADQCPCNLCLKWHTPGCCGEDLSDCTGQSFDKFCSHCGDRFTIGHQCRCARCHGRHPAADCPASDAIIPHTSGCLGCGFRHASHLPCPCLRCHSRHPEADCPGVARPQPLRLSNLQRTRELALSPNVESVAAHNCGSMTVLCPHCRARSWPSERMNCCRQGSIHVPNLNEVPAEFGALILSPHVRSNFRIYNSLMALASVGHSNKSIVGGTFVLGGSSYHRIGSLVPGAS
jgi:hypothetical protein